MSFKPLVLFDYSSCYGVKSLTDFLFYSLIVRGTASMYCCCSLLNLYLLGSGSSEGVLLE